mgnify:CR=1 FL=1
MTIGINGYYLNTPNSGIGQYTRNLLRSLSEIDKENKYFLFTPTHVSDLKFSSNFKIITIKPLKLFTNTFINRFFWEEYQSV